VRKSWQYMLLGAAIAFFVLYGIELSSDGMEDVYGPLGPRSVDRTETERGGYGSYGGGSYPAGPRGGTVSPHQDPYGAWPGDTYGETGTGDAPDQDDGNAWPERTGGYDGYGYPYAGAEGGGGAVSRLADGTAGLLQSMAKGGIRFIVSLFESVTQ
jgi:hypothetical protein